MRPTLYKSTPATGWIALALVTALLAGPLAAAAQSAPTGSAAVTPEEVLAANPAAADNPALQAQVAVQLAQQQALADSVTEISPELARRIDAAQSNVRRQLLAQFAAQTFLAAHPPSEQEIEAAYRKLVASLPKTQYWLRWIVVPDETRAQSVLDALKSGQADFAQLALRESTAPNGELGGALGWQAETALPASMLAVVRTLKPGQVAGPIVLDQGYAIVQLLAERAAPVPTLEQMRGQLVQNLQNAALQRYVQGLAKGKEPSGAAGAAAEGGNNGRE